MGSLSSRQRAILAITACVVALDSYAQEVAAPAAYAVLSLIGDELSIVTYQPAIGSRLDTNLVERVPIAGNPFDRVAAQSASAAIVRALPGASTRTLAATRALPDDVDELPDSAATAKSILGDVAQQLIGTDIRYLLVISKHRGEARISMAHQTTGSGRLQGLGFYLDNERRMTVRSNGHSGHGFIAPFAYLNVTIIDVRTGSVVKSESSSEAHALATARSENAAIPWEAMSADEKVNAINRLIRRAMTTIVPHVVAPT